MEGRLKVLLGFTFMINQSFIDETHAHLEELGLDLDESIILDSPLHLDEPFLDKSLLID